MLHHACDLISAELCTPGDVRNFISWHSLHEVFATSTQQHPQTVSKRVLCAFRPPRPMHA